MYTFNVNQQQLQMIINALSTYSESFKGLGESMLRSAMAQEAAKKEQATSEVEDVENVEAEVVETQNENEQQ